MLPFLGPACALALAGSTPASAASDGKVLMAALTAELERSGAALKNAEKAPLYFLGYEARDDVRLELEASEGALEHENDERRRTLDIDARVGSPQLDNTHQIKRGWEPSDRAALSLPVENDEAALRTAIWKGTDKAYTDALRRFERVRANREVTAAEEDPSDDFSKEPPSRYFEWLEAPNVDRPVWRRRLRELSSAFKPYPFVYDSSVQLSVVTENRVLVNTEGARVANGNRFVRLFYQIRSRTDDGMELERYKSYDAETLEALPPDATILADMKKSADELKALLAAPLVEPFHGPAIIRNRATAVLFHEILGHRLEGHRQKIESEGQTFTKLIGKPVTADFISVYDDPTLETYGGTFLRGFYRFDDEAVPSSRVRLIRDGVLESFLMSRSPVRGFPRSNAHGRRSEGNSVVARMGNTIVEASKTESYEALRAQLIAEIKRQAKPYGLIFDDISGGFTSTQRGAPQAFKVLPLLVYRLYADGRPDEVVRGADLIGTPLLVFSKIIAAADDPAVFDGTCGAESGWVPVSAVAPSVLVSEIEVDKKAKSSRKPPLLPPPSP
jgi:TldD protein